MRILLIFDQEVDLENLKKKIGLLKPSYISLFSLTSQWRCIRGVEKVCRSIDGAKIELMESAKLVEKEVDVVREKISKWSAELGERKIDSRSIKEWFLLPRGEVSTWWFSLLSEKNPLKTDIFLNIAQLGAIDKAISSHAFDICISSLHRKDLLRVIEKICKRYSVNMLAVSQLRKKTTFKKRIKSYLAKYSLLNSILKTMLYLRVSISMVILAKLAMGPVKNRQKKFDNSILFVSYFPLIDKKSAKKGELRNKFAIPLQEKITQMKKKIIWIWMYVSLDGYTFRDALRLAAKFAENGETNFFLDEFMSPKLLIRSLLLWFCQVRIFMRLNKKIPDHFLYGNLSIPETAVLIRNLMVESYLGWPGLASIMYLELYKEVFSYFSELSHCIYYFEMQAWEKALNVAKQLKAPAMTTVAFQHSFLPRNYFPYFCHQSEIAQREKPLSLPLPDILTCNGDIPLSRMSDSGYPNLRKVEAVRFSYLAHCLNNPRFPRKERIVLIPGSLLRNETLALISLLYEAFPHPKGFKVWLKAHPYLPLEEILEELGIQPNDSEYVVKHDPISELVKVARVVLAGSSSVTLEALASGCKVILSAFVDCMLLSPLDEFDRFYTKVSTPSELRQAIYKIMEEGEAKNDKRDIVDFISNYWCFDESLRRWEEILI